jgi:oxygen-dependent protoporphyrinogen oxidase
VIGRMTSAFGLEVMPIGGSMLNVHLGGRLVRDTRPELFPFKLPLPLGARLSFARAGLRVRRDAARYMKLIERRPGDTDAAIRLRALKYRGDQSFSDFLGPLHPDVFAIFEALANRSLADPGEISESAMAALFGHVWDTGDLGRNMRGGSGLLPGAIGASLGDLLRVGARVEEIRPDNGGVRIRYTTDAGTDEVRARTVIVTVPSPLVPALMPALAERVREALSHVTFGSMVVLSILTREAEPMPWDNLYSILTPDCAFNMLFNHANFLRGSGNPKQGSVLMVYGGGRRARALLDRSEDDIRDVFLADIDRIYPQVRGLIAETFVKKWRYGGPFAAPGRWRAQDTLERGIDETVFFAGDWVSEFVSMETAARTAADAAANVRRVLEARTATSPSVS